MRRILATLFCLFAVTAGLSTAPAQAHEHFAEAPAIASTCPFQERWEWPAGKQFRPGECYRTPGGYLVMQHDGNLVIYDNSWHAKCASGTAGWPGAEAFFQHDENFVIYYYGYAIAWSGTFGNPPGTLIFNRNAELRIRNAQGFLVWDMCRNGFHHPW